MRYKFTKNEKNVLSALKDGLNKTNKQYLSKQMFRLFVYERVNDSNKSRAFKKGLDSLLKKGFITCVDNKFTCYD